MRANLEGVRVHGRQPSRYWRLTLTSHEPLRSRYYAHRRGRNPSRHRGFAAVARPGLPPHCCCIRANNRVRIFERFETPRAVGSGVILQPTGLAALSELRLIAQISKLGIRIDRLFGRVMPSNRVVLDVRVSRSGSPAGTVLRYIGRRCSARCMMRPSRSGIQHLTASATVAAPLIMAAIGPQYWPPTAARTTASISWSDALGANSPLAAGYCTSADRLCPLRRPLGECALAATMEGCCRTRSNSATIRQAAWPGILPNRTPCPWRESPLAAFFLEPQEKARSSGIVAGRRFHHGVESRCVAMFWPEARRVSIPHHRCRTNHAFAQYDHFTLRTPYSDRLVHIGDATRATSPQLGQGANMALLDAFRRWRRRRSDADSRPAGKSSRLHVHAPPAHMGFSIQWASATFTPFYQSDSRLLPLVRDWLAAPLSRLPIADVLLARLVSGTSAAPPGAAANSLRCAWIPQAEDLRVSTLGIRRRDRRRSAALQQKLQPRCRPSPRLSS